MSEERGVYAHVSLGGQLKQLVDWANQQKEDENQPNDELVEAIQKWLRVRKDGGFRSQEDEWLRALLEERERMAEGWVIAESLVKQIDGLHEELEAKDKVLDLYARGWPDRREARNILSQYKTEDKE